LAPFCQCPRYNCSTGSRKGILKHPKRIILKIHQEEVGSSNKSIWIASVSIGKSISEAKVSNCRTTLLEEKDIDTRKWLAL
jgi:hypothetical protein